MSRDLPTPAWAISDPDSAMLGRARYGWRSGQHLIHLRPIERFEAHVPRRVDNRHRRTISRSMERAFRVLHCFSKGYGYGLMPLRDSAGARTSTRGGSS